MNNAQLLFRYCKKNKQFGCKFVTNTPRNLDFGKILRYNQEE